MIKFIAFDLDGTLAPHNQHSTFETVEKLKWLEQKGIIICFISGKPIGHVTGMARQMGLENPIVSGENGAIIYFGTDFPIKKEVKFSYSDNELTTLKQYQEKILAAYSDSIWVQPNEVNYSFFADDKLIFNEISEFTENHFKNSNFNYYFHNDGCIDIVYKDVHKGWAIKKIKEELGLEYNQMVSVGDGVNDLPMFKETLFEIGINRTETPITVKNIDEAMAILKTLVNEQLQCPSCGHNKIMFWKTNAKRLLGECDKCEHTTDYFKFDS